MRSNGRIQRVYIHHTHTGRETTAEQIRRMHVDGRGWTDVGYHWLLRYPSDGAPVELHAGRPEGIKGAHVRGRNAGSIGIAMIWRADNEPPPAVLLEEVAQVAASVCRRHGLPHEAVRGHGEATATACPGRHVNMDALRERVAQLLSPTDLYT